jgi:hypothetical protein
MWSTLIGLIERSWKEKPRRDVLLVAVLLHDSMNKCQHRYKRYKAVPNVGLLSPLRSSLEREWMRSLVELRERISRLDYVLSIFSPEAHEAICRYRRKESSQEADAVRELEATAQVLGQSPQLDIQNKTMDDAYSDALKQLKVFIADNFSVQEVFAVRRHKKRLWRERIQ